MARPGLPSSLPNWGLWVPEALKGQIIIGRESEAWAPQSAAKINRGGGVLNSSPPFVLLFWTSRAEAGERGNWQGGRKHQIRPQGAGLAAAWGGEGLGAWSTSVPWLSMCSSHGRPCPCLLRLPEEGQGMPKRRWSAAGGGRQGSWNSAQWFQEGEAEPFCWLSCSEA